MAEDERHRLEAFVARLEDLLVAPLVALPTQIREVLQAGRDLLRNITTEVVILSPKMRPADLTAALYILCYKRKIDPRRRRGHGWKKLRDELRKLELGLPQSLRDELQEMPDVTLDRHVREYLTDLDAGKITLGSWRTGDAAPRVIRRLRLGPVRSFYQKMAEIVHKYISFHRKYINL